MIDTASLHTASLYINNQLLSRGLLRDGQPIDFAHVENGGPGTAGETAGRIISIVNDLILRRDRDAQHLESLSAAMRSLRAENAKLTSDLARLSEKKAEERRQAAMASAAEATARSQLRTAEANTRSLKEDVTRMKALVSQTRSACATEVRRRDRQNDALKKQLVEAGRWRGAKTNSFVTTIHVTESSSEEKDELPPAMSTSSEGYDLRSETNAFLAKLAQELSEENEFVLEVMRRTASQLRNMSGYDGGRREEAVVATRRLGCEELSAELEAVMTHMRTILTNPSFVPIEEVVLREEEIDRLKAGWLKMESRWKEAVQLLDGWRKRMAASGRLVCDDDDELRLGLGRLSPERIKEEVGVKGGELETLAEEEEEEAGDEQEEAGDDDNTVERWSSSGLSGGAELGGDEEHLVDASNANKDEDEDEDEDDFVENWRVEQVSLGPHRQPSPPPSSSSPPLPSPPQLSPLRTSSSAGKRGSLQNRRLRPRPTPPTPRPRSPSRTSLDDVLLGGNNNNNNNNNKTKTSIATKLAASERDADAARLRAKLEAARKKGGGRDRGVVRPVIEEPSSSSSSLSSPSSSSIVVRPDVDKRMMVMPSDHGSVKAESLKRVKRGRKVVSRRRSTLSPLELEALLAGGHAT
ncbi:hypothetical protein XA68_14434 [Ophiocordyceps unilateralis]|uniref:NIMA interactive protein n=1 Tax=Ophiocordyceps unilateralis TaxID=268505 RepID=A0A2A9P9A9_OPHUN|nr:hypothetical protein XA68_14434 [Ophiocordyceps unilateralis]